MVKGLSLGLRAMCGLFSLLAITAHAIPGSPGTLDAFWATGNVVPGKVITPVSSGDNSARAMVLQPDGKVVLVGDCRSFTTTLNDFCALRYNADGTPDASFGSGGKVITSMGGTGSTDIAYAVALQADGKLVLAGSCSNASFTAFCALRYSADGTLDLSFNSTGKVITIMPGGNNSEARGIALQPDGKLVLAGGCNNAPRLRDFCALRYLANGTLDPSFGSGGTVLSEIGGNNEAANAVVLQPDGKLVLAGYCHDARGTGDNSDDFDFFCAQRLLPNGAFDPSFGNPATGGAIFFDSFTPVRRDVATAIILQPDGKLVLTGKCGDGDNVQFCALRSLANGTPDLSFGVNGKTALITVVRITDVSSAVALQPDGKLVLAGTCVLSTRLPQHYTACAVRYHANGGLDTSFDGDGKVVTQIGGVVDQINAVLLQPDGKLLLAGGCGDGTRTDFCSLRYDGGPFGYQNCKPDIDGDGRMTATIDGLINMRVMLGISGVAVMNGITFPSNATRKTWPLIRDYLVTQCGMSLAP